MTHTPITKALAQTKLELEQATEYTEQAEHNADISVDEHKRRLVAQDDVERKVDALRERLAASDEPRNWRLCEAGRWYTAVQASNCAAALAEARGNVDASNYDVTETIWIDVAVHCIETDESDEATVVLHPAEPKCSHAGHDWQSPYEIVGGLECNPGVWGHGGGVKVEEVCMHCGCARLTDTWAQRPDTGEQGLTSTTYEPGKFAEQIAGVES
jgi:hypothetical protein